MPSIYAIPGFLGLRSDWDFLGWPKLKAIDMHAYSWKSLADWAKDFNEQIAHDITQPAILMGYSLGGRLALHALIDKPHQWQAAIIISAHSGLTSDFEKQQRLQHDQRWAERFANEQWSSLMHDWNNQAVFATETFDFERQEKDYHRRELIEILTQGSLGWQANLQQQICQLSIPLLWITGGNDLRYNLIAQNLSFVHPKSRWISIPKSGHRVPWSQPQAFNQSIQEFLNDSFIN